MKKKFLVIGMGRFGFGVVKELYKSKHEIVVCDVNESTLQAVDRMVQYTVLGDAKEDSVLDDLEVENFDAIVVAIGDGFESAILITNKLKNRNCQKIITKANDKERGEILKAVGADVVVYPEEEAGTRTAKQLSFTNLLEYIELNEDISAIEMKVPKEFYGKTLSEMDFTKKFGLTVALIMRNNHPISANLAYEPFMHDDRFLMIGENHLIQKFQDAYCD